MRPFKTERNRELVLLRLNDPKLWSIGMLGKKYKLNKRTVWDIFQRDYIQFGTPKQIKKYLTWLNK